MYIHRGSQSLGAVVSRRVRKQNSKTPREDLGMRGSRPMGGAALVKIS